MADTWIVNMQHYLDKDGSIIPEGSPARKLPNYFGTIVSFASDFASESGLTSDLRCRRRPRRKRCEGKIQAWLELDTDAIIWKCPICGDKGAISGWEDTVWDFS